jgi:hypothetical protein
LNRATRSGYLLGYYPPSQEWKGDYRRIEVKVNRPNVKILFRRGYYATRQVDVYDHEVFQGYWRLSTAANYPQEVADIPFTAIAQPQNTASGGKSLLVQLSLDGRAVPFHLQDGLQTGKLEVAIFLGDTQGKPLGEPLMQTLSMTLRESTYQRVLKEGIPFSAELPLLDADPRVKVVVYNYEADKLGIRWAKFSRDR